MTKRHPRRTDEEWRTLIQECRTSGLTDKHWCQNHNIQPSNLYYHIRRLEEKSCNIANSYAETSEIVQLSFDETITDSSERKTVIPESSFDTTIRIQKHGFLIELSNHAARDTILAILSVLQNLC